MTHKTAKLINVWLYFTFGLFVVHGVYYSSEKAMFTATGIAVIGFMFSLWCQENVIE